MGRGYGHSSWLEQFDDELDENLEELGDAGSLTSAVLDAATAPPRPARSQQHQRRKEQQR